MRWWRFPAIGLLILYAFHLVYWVPIEVKLSSMMCLAIGLISPVLSLYALALFGGFYLENPGANYNLSHLDCLVVSALLHELIWKQEQGEGAGCPNGWKFFRACLLGLGLLLLGSSVPGVIHWWLEASYTPWWAYLIGSPTWGYATYSSWTVKSLFNWFFAFGVFWLAYRYATYWVVVRFLKFAAVGALLITLLGFVDYLLYPQYRGVPLILLKETFGSVNPDPLHYGRFSATATHAGWLGQWLVLTLPGFVVWYTTVEGQRKKRLVVACALPVLLGLLLTFSRAPWFGALVGAGVGFLVLGHSLSKKIGAREVFRFSAVLIGGLALSAIWNPVLMERRLSGLLRVQDRLNYVYSSLDLLARFPLGIGLGTHYPLYTEYFFPDYRYYQMDHVEIHQFLLHLITENSVLILLPVSLFVWGLGSIVLRGWKRTGASEQVVLGAMLMALSGITIVSLAQYVFYIRPVELCIWVYLGFTAGLCAHHGALPGLLGRLRRPVIIAGGVSGLILALVHLNSEPWKIDPRDTGISESVPHVQKWIQNKTQFAVDSEVRAIEMDLHVREDVGTITIIWPEGDTEEVLLSPGEVRTFTRTLQPAARSFPSRWMTLECEKTWRPVEIIEGSVDHRRLGVYISRLEFIK